MKKKRVKLKYKSNKKLMINWNHDFYVNKKK